MLPPTRLFFWALVLSAALLRDLIFCSEALGQSVYADPDCGVPGDEFEITGEGWSLTYFPGWRAYLFRLGDEEVAEHYLEHPSGDPKYAGQPSTQATVPDSLDLSGITPEDLYEVFPLQVELAVVNESPGDYIDYRTTMQCRETDFRVIEADVSPWFPEIPDASNVPFIDFLPPATCSIRFCDQIELVQVVKLTGTEPGGAERSVLPSELLYLPNAEILDQLMTSQGWFADIGPRNELFATRRPEFRGFLRGDRTWRKAYFGDNARFSVPAGLEKLRADFEVAAYCWEGSGQSYYTGSLRWKTERSLGETANTHALEGTPSKGQPSSDLVAAVNKYVEVVGKELPLPFPPEGGRSCAQ